MYLPVLIIFGVQLGFSLYSVPRDTANLLPALVNSVILLIVLRFYSKIRRTIPFTLEVNDDKIIAYNYLMSSKKVEEKIADIVKIDGGIFSGKPASPVVIFFKDGEHFGILPHLKDYTDFISLVLQKVDKKIHDETVLKIKQVADARMSKRKKKPKK
jgi:hypothetical protein